MDYQMLDYPIVFAVWGLIDMMAEYQLHNLRYLLDTEFKQQGRNKDSLWRRNNFAERQPAVSVWLKQAAKGLRGVTGEGLENHSGHHEADALRV